MPRPGVIVGLGGTGQWVLTWLKRDLLLSNNGQMPSNVRLLEVDTATRLEAGTTRVTATGKKEEDAVVGGVKLEKGEFIYIGGNSLPVAEGVRANKPGYNHIRAWYQADRWLSTQSPATFILDDGAGRLRQFGRMAVFKDLLGRETGSNLWRAFHTALEAVRSSTNEQRRLEIIVVGSFAGGTGSGMFIDIALLLRMMAHQLNIHHVLRGYFALPGVFTTNPDDDMKARSFAAWRELNRFMVVDEDFRMPSIEYIEGSSKFRIEPSRRIFDACYLVDGKRGGQPLAEEAKYGVFPMMSEAISAILDEQAGSAYTEWITTNLAPEYARRPDMPMYSSVGAFTVQVPAHFVQEISSHQYAQEVLLRILKPTKKPDAEGRLISIGAERHLALASVNQNQEDPGFSGRMRSRALLRETAVYGKNSLKPTPFHGRIGQLVEQATDQQRRATIVDQLARAAGADIRSAAASQSWVAYFPDMGDDPQFEAVRRRLIEFMNYSVIEQYKHKDKQTADEVRANFRRIPDDLRRRFGGINAAGEEVEEFHGACGEVLQECERVQLSLFRQVVRLRLLRMLNGEPDSTDIIKARSGKLGYAWDFFDGLVNELDEFLKLMSEVRQRREQVKPQLQIAGMAKNAERFLQSSQGKKFFWLWEHPDVRGSESAYLQAQQRLMEIRREDILHYYVTETARSMKEICIETRDSLQRWIWALTTGDDASQSPGLWNSVQQSLHQIKNAHSYDTTTPKVQKMVADNPLPLEEADIEEVLRRWEWKVDLRESGLDIQVNLLPLVTGEAADTLKNPVLEFEPAKRMAIAQGNQQAFLRSVSKKFSGVVARSTVAEEIKRSYPTPKEFANAVVNVSGEPLFDGVPLASPIRKSNFIRVQTPPNDPYFSGAQGLEGELREMNNVDRSIRTETYGIQVVQSEHPYKLTLVRTDDLYQYDHYAAWEQCLTAYEAHVKSKGKDQLLDPVLMQNFPAEGRAVEFERRIADTKGLKYKSLHPRVVMLLEDPRALRQFIYLGILRKIVPVEDNRGYRWQLNSENTYGERQTIWLTRLWNRDLDKVNRPVQPDIMNAMHGYIIQRRSQEPNRDLPINHEGMQRMIDANMKGIGPKAEAKLIDENIKGGFSKWLRDLAYEYPQDLSGVKRQDYADLAAVVELMLRDRYNELERPKHQSPSTDVAAGDSPFATYEPQKKPKSAKKPATTKKAAPSAVEKPAPPAKKKDAAESEPEEGQPLW